MTNSAVLSVPVSVPVSAHASAPEIILSAPANLRDLGGIAIDGGTLTERLAIRTDDLSIVTPEYAATLVAGGLTAIIDLRSTAEVATTGRGRLGDLAVTYHHIPLMVDIGESMGEAKNASAAAPKFSHEIMGHSYIGMVENAAPQLVTALNIIAFDPGAAAFHCSAGRDRTGVLAAMLLLALGASDDDIIADYGRTGPNMSGVGQRTRSVMRPLLLRLGFDIDAMQSMGLEGTGMEVSMEMLIAHLRETYGDPLTPLRNAGLSEATIARLHTRALGAEQAVAG